MLHPMLAEQAAPTSFAWIFIGLAVVFLLVLGAEVRHIEQRTDLSEDARKSKVQSKMMAVCLVLASLICSVSLLYGNAVESFKTTYHSGPGVGQAK